LRRAKKSISTIQNCNKPRKQEKKTRCGPDLEKDGANRMEKGPEVERKSPGAVGQAAIKRNAWIRERKTHS